MQKSYYNSNFEFINFYEKPKKIVIFIQLSKNSFLCAFWKNEGIWLLYEDNLSSKK